MERNEFFVLSAAALASGSQGDKATLAVPCKAELIRSYVKWEGTSAHATAAVIKFDRRQTAGSDGSDRGDGDCGVLKKVASVAQQGKVTYADPASRVILNTGDEIVVEVTTAQGEALAFQAWVRLREIPEVPANQAHMVLTA